MWWRLSQLLLLLRLLLGLLLLLRLRLLLLLRRLLLLLLLRSVYKPEVQEATHANEDNDTTDRHEPLLHRQAEVEAGGNRGHSPGRCLSCSPLRTDHRGRQRWW